MSSRSLLIRQLTEEYFADDLAVPAASSGWTDAELTQFYQSGGAVQPEAVTPEAAKPEAETPEAAKLEAAAHPAVETVVPPAATVTPLPAAMKLSSHRVARVRCDGIELKLTLTRKLLDRSLEQSVVEPFLKALGKKRGVTLTASHVVGARVGGAMIDDIKECFATPAGTLLTEEEPSFTLIEMSIDTDVLPPTASISDADPGTAVARLLASANEFEALGLPCSEVSPTMVRRSFRQVSLVVHPDKCKDPQAAEAFRKAFEAMQTLTNPARQKARLRQIEKGGGSGPEGWGGAASSLPPEMRWWDGASVSEMESSFRMMEDYLAAQGAFGDDQLDANLWVAAKDADRLRSEGLAMFVDSRDASAFAISHIVGALSLPGHTMEELQGLADHPTVHRLRASPAALVVVYSDNGSKLSRCVHVSGILRKLLAPERVRRLTGGLNGWKRDGLPVDGDAMPMFAGQARQPYDCGAEMRQQLSRGATEEPRCDRDNTPPREHIEIKHVEPTSHRLPLPRPKSHPFWRAQQMSASGLLHHNVGNKHLGA